MSAALVSGASRWLPGPELLPSVGARAGRLASGTAPGVGDGEQLIEVLVGERGLVPATLLVLLSGELQLNLVERALPLPALAPPAVGGLQQLGQILGLECLALLDDPAPGPQSKLFGAVSRRAAADQVHHQPAEDQATEDKDREAVHRVSLIARRRRRCPIAGEYQTRIADAPMPRNFTEGAVLEGLSIATALTRSESAGPISKWMKEAEMRLRFAVLASALSACAFTVAPSIADAHGPVHNRALTIHNSPHAIVAGEPVLIYGRLQGRDSAGQEITLYHRINPNAQFTVISRGVTDGSGRYEFTRAEGIVMSNRSWFVKGPVFTHSKTVHERVAAEVSIAASASEVATGQAVTFTGHVDPSHAGQSVILQGQRGDNGWVDLTRGRLDAGSNYSIAYKWARPGARDVRVVFAGDARNTAGVSSVAAVVVDQKQLPGFTIDSSQAIVPNATPTTISGMLDMPGTTTPEPGTSVSLYSRAPGGTFALAQTATTDANGDYTFTVESTTNMQYQARTTYAPLRDSAVVLQGVQDAVTLTSSSTTSTVGGTVTFTGNVSPGKPGEAVYLQRLGRDGFWHTVKSSTLGQLSNFSIAWSFGTAGIKQFRVQIPGDGTNVGGASAPVSETVAQPPVGNLPLGG